MKPLLLILAGGLLVVIVTNWRMDRPKKPPRTENVKTSSQSPSASAGETKARRVDTTAKNPSRDAEHARRVTELLNSNLTREIRSYYEENFCDPPPADWCKPLLEVSVVKRTEILVTVKAGAPEEEWAGAFHAAMGFANQNTNFGRFTKVRVQDGTGKALRNRALPRRR